MSMIKKKPVPIVYAGESKPGFKMMENKIVTADTVKTNASGMIFPISKVMTEKISPQISPFPKYIRVSNQPSWIRI